MQQKSLAQAGTVLFYLGGAVWILYALVKYLLGWDVSLRQFLPYHLAAVIPGVILKRCSGFIAAVLNRS
jgi:hypothetical protein